MWRLRQYNAFEQEKLMRQGRGEPLLADFGIMSESDGLLVVIPDLVASELRLVKLAR